MNFFTLGTYIYLLTSVGLFFTYLSVYWIFRSKISFSFRRKLHSYLIICASITFLLGFFLNSTAKDILKETFIEGKWSYGNEYYIEDPDTGQGGIAIDKEFIANDPQWTNYLYCIEILIYFLWLTPGLLIFSENKRIDKEQHIST